MHVEFEGINGVLAGKISRLENLLLAEHNELLNQIYGARSALMNDNTQLASVISDSITGLEKGLIGRFHEVLDQHKLTSEDLELWVRSELSEIKTGIHQQLELAKESCWVPHFDQEIANFFNQVDYLGPMFFSVE